MRAPVLRNGSSAGAQHGSSLAARGLALVELCQFTLAEHQALATRGQPQPPTGFHRNSRNAGHRNVAQEGRAQITALPCQKEWLCGTEKKRLEKQASSPSASPLLRKPVHKGRKREWAMTMGCRELTQTASSWSFPLPVGLERAWGWGRQELFTLWCVYKTASTEQQKASSPQPATKQSPWAAGLTSSKGAIAAPEWSGNILLLAAAGWGERHCMEAGLTLQGVPLNCTAAIAWGDLQHRHFCHTVRYSSSPSSPLSLAAELRLEPWASAV